MYLVIQVVMVLEEEDNMNFIETTVPISIEKLKIYFNDKNTKFLIDYDNSTLKDEKFLTYISNLDIPCDINFDFTNEKHQELLKNYFHTFNIVDLNSLSLAALDVCLTYNFKLENEFTEFVKCNEDIVTSWVNILQSMSLFNLHSIQSEKFKEYVDSFPKKESPNTGLNFVNLLKLENMNTIFEGLNTSELFVYDDYFNSYMFKGKNLYQYWANENNPMFLLTWSISENNISPQNHKELESAASI
jgi:hypothetical protein